LRNAQEGITGCLAEQWIGWLGCWHADSLSRWFRAVIQEEHRVLLAKQKVE